MEILNAKITSTSITMADHGCLTFWITIEGGAWGVSIGGYSIGHGYLGADEFDGYGPGLEAMMRIMDVVGVDTWEDLKDKYIRVESDGWGRTIKTIGHITDDKWFNIDEFFKSKAKDEKGVWIPVKWKLPDVPQRYLVYTKEDDIITDLFMENGKFMLGDDIIAWQPLPKPYESEAEK